ncbi:hypothetical protein Tco_0868039 [Tanacetum coccineum]
MPPTLMTRNAGRPATASRGGEMGGRAGRGGDRTRSRSGDQVMIGLMVKVGKNQNGDAANDNIRGDVSRGCTYKEFLACNPKEYDSKRRVIVYTHWIEKMESVQDMSGYRDSQKVKYTTSSFVGDEVYLVFERHLEEIHVTWAHLEKKRTRLQTYTKFMKNIAYRTWRRRHSKLDDMIELPKLQPKRTYNKDLECEIVMVKMPKCMAWLYDEPIGDLDTIEDKVIFDEKKLGSS